MGNMGFGYGSEYQLLRFLGRYRNEFNQNFRNQLNLQKDISWFDFVRNKSKDKEILNTNFIKSDTLKKLWSEIWPTNDEKSGINWDLVGIIENEYILVEAKANLAESNQKIGAKEPAKSKAINSIKSLWEKYGLEYTDFIHEKMYQLANRLVFLDFMESQGYNVKLVYLYFINGYKYSYINPKLKNQSVLSIEEWKINIQEYYKNMNILGSKLEEKINYVFIDCEFRND